MLENDPQLDSTGFALEIHALDREQMLKTLFYGHGTLGNDHPIASVNRFCARDLPQRRYDPDRAKFHLKKAGLDRLKVQLHASDTVLGIGNDMAALFQQTATPANIDIEVVREPSDGYWDNVWLKKPFFEGFWAGRPTEDWMFTQAYASQASWNEASWKNPRFDELLLLARAETDTEKRQAMYSEMQRICSDDGGVIIPIFTNILDAAHARVATGKLAGNLAGDGARCAERWWFKA